MNKHNTIYNKFFGYQPGDYRPCEVCGAPGTDTHHMDARGMGGDPKGTKDNINNLMALCRKCHTNYGDKKDFMEILSQIHARHLYLAKVENELYKALMAAN